MHSPTGILTRLITKEKLPLVIEPVDPGIKLPGFLRLLSSERDFFNAMLLKHGGLLFRNFPIESALDFTSLIKSLSQEKFINYIGGDSPRKKIHEGVYTSTEAPPSLKIPMHNELSYNKNYPSHIYFYCETPAPEGGETIICDARKVYQSIKEEVRERFMKKRILYLSSYYYKSRFMDFINSFQKGHRSWIDVFETSDRREVEKICRENDIAFRWGKSDWLEMSQIRPAFIAHPKTGEMVWFNQAHLFDFNRRLLGLWRYVGAKILYCRKEKRLHQVLFADREKIPQSDLYHILDVLDANALFFPWQKGDVLVLDNLLAMHGRSTFKGPRRILTAMTG